MIEIYSDGACSGNPGIGGWGAVIRHPNGKEVELNGAEPYTTNNRMELLAAIVALESLKNNTRQVILISDSQYLIKGASGWMNNWERNGWRNSKREEVPNKDLWYRIKTLKALHSITWTWVRGHSGHPENERCDKLARQAILEVRSGKRTC